MSRLPALMLALMVPAPALAASQVITPAPRPHELQFHAMELQRAAADLHLTGSSLAHLVYSWSSPADGPPALDPDHQDPADGLYRQAREALNRSEYTRAIELFGQIRARHPRSAHTPDAYYWEAFAQQRRGTTESLHQAMDLLLQQEERHPDAATRRDARSLQIRIQSALASRGDAASAAAMFERGAMIAPTPPTPPTPPVPPTPGVVPTPPTPPVPPVRGQIAPSRCAGEDEEQVMVLNGLMNMDADRAVPLLERVMARRDASSTCLRRRAVFLLGQKQSSRTEQLLLDAARSDPDAEVREQAIFWLGQSGGPRAAAALDSILRTSTDPKIQVRAIFSLAQGNSATAGPVLRSYAGRADVSREVRDQAVFWLGQTGTAEDARFLQDLYRRERDEGIKERILFSVAQNHAAQASTGPWLAAIAANSQEPIKLRKNAIFWAGQTGAPLADLIRAYDQMPEAEMKEQVIFVLSQRSEREATDKLIAIARTDKDAKLKARALFWLGQRNDPRAQELYLEILERRPPE
ncbi:MAG: HEAT repeat domain-containing protein [Gemmatimonadales bacterium]|nr:HEAT repeat domain-containing protein [Gemmatimonadales bacterium]